MRFVSQFLSEFMEVSQFKIGVRQPCNLQIDGQIFVDLLRSLVWGFEDFGLEGLVSPVDLQFCHCSIEFCPFQIADAWFSLVLDLKWVHGKTKDPIEQLKEVHRATHIILLNLPPGISRMWTSLKTDQIGLTGLYAIKKMHPNAYRVKLAS